MSHRYKYCGLLVESTEWIRALEISRSNSQPDIVVQRASLSIPERRNATSGPNWSIGQDVAWWWLRDKALFRIRPGSIEFDARNIEDSLLHALLLEGPMVMAMIFNGQFCVNAASVLKDEQTFVFCGAAGSGRSTAAARLAIQGGKIITDSLARIKCDQRHARIYPQGRGTLLWPQSLRNLGFDETYGDRVRNDSALRQVKLNEEHSPQAIKLLYWRNPKASGQQTKAEFGDTHLDSIGYRFRRIALMTAGRLWIDPAGKSLEHFRWCSSTAERCQIEAAPPHYFTT